MSWTSASTVSRRTVARTWDLAAYTPEILALGCDRCGRGIGRRCKDQAGRDVGPHAERRDKGVQNARDRESETRGRIFAYQDIWQILTDAHASAEPYSDLRALSSAIVGVEDRLRLLQDGKGGESFGKVFIDRSGEPPS